MASSYGANAMSDADIASIVTTANQGEIDQANAALAKASSSDVRDFAQMMVRDHTNALNATQSLISNQNITPTDNATSTALRSGSQQTISALNTYSGTNFDRTYMQAMVDAHQWLLNTMDSTLIPSAHSRALRDLLQTQRTTVAAHLDRARTILNGLPR
jgi:putative membrane protein